MTSNLGSPYILEGISEDGEISQEAKEQVNKLLRQSFRPEFLNRMDEIVFYKPLIKEEIYKIIDILIADLQERLEDRHIKLKLTETAKQYIVDSAYDPTYGARPLKRFLQSKVETLVARLIISDKVRAKSTITVNYDGKELQVDVETL